MRCETENVSYGDAGEQLQRYMYHIYSYMRMANTKDEVEHLLCCKLQNAKLTILIGHTENIESFHFQDQPAPEPS